MALLSKEEIQAIVFNTFGMHRFLQDSPIRPDVWERFLTLASRGGGGDKKVSMILTPKQARPDEGVPIGRATELSMVIADRLGRNSASSNGVKVSDKDIRKKAQHDYRIAAISRHVVIEVTFRELIIHLLPQTAWWKGLHDHLKVPSKVKRKIEEFSQKKTSINQSIIGVNDTEFFRFAGLAALINYMIGRFSSDSDVAGDTQFKAIVHALAPNAHRDDQEIEHLYTEDQRPSKNKNSHSTIDLSPLWDSYLELAMEMQHASNRHTRTDGDDSAAKTQDFRRDGSALWSDTSIWSIQCNRRASRQAPIAAQIPQWMKPHVGADLSRDTVKADAATRLFSISTSNLVWAVVDTGIDALHPAFCNKTEKGEALIDNEGELILDWEGIRPVRARDVISIDSGSVTGKDTSLPDEPSPEHSLKEQWELWKARHPNLVKNENGVWLSRDGERLICRDGDWLIAYDRRKPEALGSGESTAEQNPLDRTAFLRSRVTATLDFTILHKIIDGRMTINEIIDRVPWAQLRFPKIDSPAEEKILRKQYLKKTIDAIRRHNVSGREIDWSLIEPLIRIDPYAPGSRPADPHGTHVAGILGADLPNGVPDDTRPFFGVCPDIQLYDLRVFSDDKNDGGGDEFTILAALDYISWVNRDPERPGIHGVNLSLAIRHIVDAHACGGTPICDAANRMVWAGTVVVAAAGNFGFDQRYMKESLGVGYRGMSIADPGNAEQVITVGATHRSEPHNYGVSYFSSRGPTGDGRLKPDLVAPGEKIRSTIPGQQMLVMDGTSMAAPHVSGVCALLMARHSELIGEPERIKSILMNTATDLGREHYFQGKGLVDALRALQSI